MKFDRDNDGVVTKRELAIGLASAIVTYLLTNLDVILSVL